jgi:hypothetical protein
LGGIDYTAVSRLRQRLRQKMTADHTVEEKFAKTENSIRKLCQV